MERYNGVELDPEGAFVYYDDAQRALDAEREKVKEYMTNYVPLKALEDVEAQLAQLQALVRWLPKVEIIDTAEFGPMCVAKNHFQPLTATVAEGGAYLALAELLRYRASLDPAPEENASLTAKLATLQAQAKQLGRTLADVYQQRDGLQAQLRQVEGERAKWEDIAGLRFAGDHKFVKEMELLKVENTTLRQLVEAYAKAKTVFDENRLKEDHHEWKERFNTLVEAEQALIEAAALATQDAGKVSTSIIGKQVPPSQWNKNAGVSGDVS